MPLSPHPFTECSPLQSVFYRRRELYSLGWSHASQDLHDYLLASAPHGGYIALTRDPRKLVVLGKAAVLKPKILVYTAAGQLVESIPWDPSNRIVGLGWTAGEQLAVILDEGVVRIYTLLTPCPVSSSAKDPSGQAVAGPSSTPIAATTTSYYVQYNLGSEATETGIVEAKVWSDGLVALTGAGRFVDFRFPKPPSEEEAESIWEEYTVPPAPQVLPPLPGSSSAGPNIPTAWTFVPSTVSSSGLLEVLLSPASSLTNGTVPSASASGTSTPTTSGGTVLSLDSVSGATDMRLSRGPFSSIVASPNGKLLALLTSDKKLWVVSSDFQRSLSEFDVTTCEAYAEAQSKGSQNEVGSIGQTGIRQIEWCGNNTVAVAWESEVVLVGPFGDSLRYFYPTSTHLVPELDGVRIVSADKHEMIQKVGEATEAVFRPGSSDVAAMLLDAFDSFSRRSARADEGIRAIKNDLASAVDTCIEASSQEYDVIWQRKLLKAANFGKAFLDSSYDSTSFVEMSRKLRVLNNVRSYEIGIPISFEQYESVGSTALLTRLTNRNHHLLALRIASHLRLRPDPILRHWARAKIARSATGSSALRGPVAGQDDELCETIVRKFESLGAATTVSYSSIASSAFRSGRTRLATKLLDHEPRAVDQVPLLLKMGEEKLALQKAVESGDTDLVYHVLLKLKNQLSRGDFFRVVQQDAVPTVTGDTSRLQHLALRLLEGYARVYDRELLKDLYYTDDRRTEAALLALEEADAIDVNGKSTQDAREETLSTQVFRRKDAAKLFSEDRDRQVESKLVDESIRLVSFQQALEKEDGHRTVWIGLSLNDTIRECLVKIGKGGGSSSILTSSPMLKRAEKLKSEFKLSEKRWWSLRVDAFITLRDWDGLANFVKSKRPPPLGYEPIIAKLVGVGANSEGLRYVGPLASGGERGDKAKFQASLARLPPAVAAPLRAKMEEKA